jgi:hypothetical protein
MLLTNFTEQSPRRKNLTVVEAVKKFHAFYEILKFINVFAGIRYWTSSLAR